MCKTHSDERYTIVLASLSNDLDGLGTPPKKGPTPTFASKPTPPIAAQKPTTSSTASSTSTATASLASPRESMMSITVRIVHGAATLQTEVTPETTGSSLFKTSLARFGKAYQQSPEYAIYLCVDGEGTR